MQYFSEMAFLGFNLLAGIEGEEMIFTHLLKDRNEKETLIQLEKIYFPHLKENNRALKPVFKNLTDYANGKNFDPASVKVKFSRGTDFERGVWKTLRQTTRKGSVISYKELAEKAGYNRAQQAVGQAMSKNYLLLFVPCHRVIASNGKPGGFSAGIDLKRILLNLEEVNLGRPGKNHGYQR